MRDPRPALAEIGRRTGSTVGRGVRTVCSPTGLRGAGQEIVWVVAHTAMYPLGMFSEKARAVTRESAERFTLDDLPPVQRGLLLGDVVAAGTPILLVHGLIDNRSVFTLLRRALQRRGFGRILALNYSPFTQDVRAAAARLARLVERTCEETGYERVHVVGHSLGGVVARYYVQRMGGDARVHTLVTLGSPHSGTHAAYLLPQRLVRQLRPGSALMAELAAPAGACRTRFVAFWSDLDQLIVPKQAARIDHPDLSARNVLLRGVGHMSLPISGRVVHEIAMLLAHLDEDGTTLQAGVTPLGASLPPPPAAAPAPHGTRGREDASTA
ncbi:MAG TPA: alpha/beta fold hydrolase [Mycobacteriales bacterium]|nr:alpha/beta fold hydrolase [Mycobacteriales bacterium]